MVAETIFPTVSSGEKVDRVLFSRASYFEQKKRRGEIIKTIWDLYAVYAQ